MAQRDLRFYLNGMLFVLEKDQLVGSNADGPPPWTTPRCRWKAISMRQGDHRAAETVIELSEAAGRDRRSDHAVDIPTPREPGALPRFANVEYLVSKVVDGKFPTTTA